jgi:hypothetical protein
VPEKPRWSGRGRGCPPRLGCVSHPYMVAGGGITAAVADTQQVSRDGARDEPSNATRAFGNRHPTLVPENPETVLQRKPKYGVPSHPGRSRVAPQRELTAPAPRHLDWSRCFETWSPSAASTRSILGSSH